MNKKSGFEQEDEYIKFSVSLSKSSELELSRIQLKAQESTGVKFSRSEILRAAVRFLIELKIDFADVKGEEDLLKAFIEAARMKYKEQ